MNQEIKEKKADILSRNWKAEDNISREVFEEPYLCAQFLRGYVDHAELKTVQPEDIEDMTERFLPLLTTEREADVIKKVHLGNGDKIYFVSLIEHKTQVDFDVIMKLLRYMVYIWEDYEKEQLKERESSSRSEEKTGEKVLISRNKEFKYPPILPIVYYEGTGQWTAVRNLKDRVFLSEIFGKYIPDFTYELISLRNFTNEELVKRGDEMSLIMLLNRIQNVRDIGALETWKTCQRDVLKNTPEQVVNLIARQVAVLAGHLSLSSAETEEMVNSVKERNMPKMYEFFEDFDVPKAREELKSEREELKSEREELKGEREELKSEREELEGKREELKSEREELETDKRKFSELQMEEWKRIEETWKRIEEQRRLLEESKESAGMLGER